MSIGWDCALRDASFHPGDWNLVVARVRAGEGHHRGPCSKASIGNGSVCVCVCELGDSSMVARAMADFKDVVNTGRTTSDTCTRSLKMRLHTL
eukprot:scaffold261_cov336-Pavlova_lutheri.AAC.29